MAEDNYTKDPVTGLTEAEVKAIEDSWNILYRKEHRKENGFKMIIKWIKHLRLLCSLHITYFWLIAVLMYVILAVFAYHF